MAAKNGLIWPITEVFKLTVVLKQRFLARSAKINHTLAENAFCMIGFGRRDIGWYLAQLAILRNPKGREYG